MIMHTDNTIENSSCLAMAEMPTRSCADRVVTYKPLTGVPYKIQLQ
jgi:hypothetical protein